MGLDRATLAGLAAFAVFASAQTVAGPTRAQTPENSLGAPPPLSAVPYILHLQPDQRDAWRAYMDAIAQDRATHLNPSETAQKLNALQTPARLDAMLDQMKLDEAAFQRRAVATKAFYGVLTPDQKKTFDTLTRLPSAPMQRPAPRDRPPPSNLPQPANPQSLPPPGAGSPP